MLMAVVRKPKVCGELLYFQSKKHIWCLNLATPALAPQPILKLKGLRAWLPFQDTHSQHLLWTRRTQNGIELWNGRVEAGALNHVEQIVCEGWPEFFSLLDTNGSICVRMQDIRGTWLGRFDWNRGRLEYLEGWNFVDGIHSLSDNSTLLTRHSIQSWRAKDYRGGQRSVLFRAKGNNLEKLKGLPYSTIWKLSVFNEQIFFCAKPSLGPASQLFCCEIIIEHDTATLAKFRQITDSSNFPLGVDNYSLSHSHLRGSFAIIEQLGQFSMIELNTEGAEPQLLELAVGRPPKIRHSSALRAQPTSDNATHLSWRSEVGKRFFNPSRQLSDSIQYIDRLLQESKRLDIDGNQQWIRRKLTQSLQSSHCQYSTRLPASGTKCTTGTEEFTQWIMAASQGRIHYLHASQALSIPNFKREGLILDLRGHPGGNSSQTILSKLGLQFSKPAAWQVDRHGNRICFPTNAGASFENNSTEQDVPWVVLIDEWTRSDSELLAHAIRFWRGPRRWPKLIGTQTAGEGLGYSGRISLEEDGWATIPEYALSLSTECEVNWLENMGIKPCLEVELSPERRELNRLLAIDALVQFALETLLLAFRQGPSRENADKI